MQLNNYKYKMNYIELKIQIPENHSDLSEIIMAQLSLFFDSFIEEADCLKAYISEKDYSREHAENICEKYKLKYSVKIIKSKNWNEEWEKSFKPVLIENSLHIRAPFHSTDKSVKHEIIIEPKMAFGTGHHETTWLMCKFMSEFDFDNQNVLDMGCGTGILAIYASMLGAKKITAIDIDEWSFKNSEENCIKNHCHNIKIICGNVDSIPENETYNYILANINLNVLKNDIAIYAKKLDKHGKLIVSGFFENELQEIKNISKISGLLFDKYITKNEWVAAIFCKTD